MTVAEPLCTLKLPRSLRTRPVSSEELQIELTRPAPADGRNHQAARLTLALSVRRLASDAGLQGRWPATGNTSRQLRGGVIATSVEAPAAG
jgi:hypothetical protein